MYVVDLLFLITISLDHRLPLSSGAKYDQLDAEEEAAPGKGQTFTVFPGERSESEPGTCRRTGKG